MSSFSSGYRQYGLGSCLLCLLISRKHGGVKDRVLSGISLLDPSVVARIDRSVRTGSQQP